MFKDLLKKLRKQRGIKTQEDLARLSGISVATIKSLESGRKQPGKETLLKLSEFFDCEIEYLLGKEREGKVVFSEDLIEAIELLEDMPEDRRRATIQLLRTMK